MNFNIDDLIIRSKEYNEDKFKIDLDNLLLSYNQLPNLDIDNIRDEIDNWDFSVPKDTTIDLEEVSGTYTKFIEYHTRINKLLDDVNVHNQLLIFIIKTGKELALQFVTGKNKEDKNAVASSILLPVSKLQNKINILNDFILSTNKSIEFSAAQLARILREREAIAKINNEEYRRGSNFINRNNIPINTRNKLK